MTHASQAYEFLSDRWMGRLSGGEWKVLYYVTRRTIGFGKQADKISLSQFQRGIRTREGRQLDNGTGLSRRAVVAAVSQLVDHGLLILRPGERNGQLNEYMVNWDLVAADSQKVTRAKSSLPARAKNAPTTLSLTTLSETATKRDLDYPPANRKKRDSRVEASLRAVSGQYPRLQEALADYMTVPDDERIYPSVRVVVDIVDAAGGHSEEEVIRCLRYLREERGLRPGTKRGPRHFSWFKTVVADYFAQRRERELVAGNIPAATVAGAPPEELFRSMTEVLEVPEEVEDDGFPF